MVKEGFNKNNILNMETHKKQYYTNYDWEDNYEKSDSPYEKKDRHNGLLEHKANTNVSELVYYLEEMYQMDMLDEIETDIYERYTYGDKITSSEWMYVYENSYTYFFEKF